MLPRILEPEVMDTVEEAREYDAMDHQSVNTSFCADLIATGLLATPILDVGTGTALIPIELCRRAAHVQVVGIDLAKNMLDLAKDNIHRADLEDRIRIERVDAKALAFATGSFGTVVSNSIIHHIPEPLGALREMLRVTAKGGFVFVRDLVRPETKEEVDRLTDLHAGDASPDQKELLRASLNAALTVDEVAELALQAGMTDAQVRLTSDRHWTLSFRRS